MEKLFITVAIITGMIGTYLFIEQLSTFNNSEERKCQLTMRRSGEEHTRFKSSAHALTWCTEHRADWQSLVTPATLMRLEK